MGLTFTRKLKQIIKGLIPDRVLFNWIFPLRDSIRYKIMYLLHWLRNPHRIRSRKTVVFISGESHTPGHVYRIQRYVETLRGLGVDSDWFDPGVVFANPAMIKGSHLLVIWRQTMNAYLKTIIEHAKAIGIPVVYDLDDYVFDPILAEPEIADAIRFQNLEKEKIKRMFSGYGLAMHRGDILTCPTTYLAKAMEKSGKPSLVLPNGYDLDTLLLSYRMIQRGKPEDGLVRIGYAGGTRTHQKDFLILVKPIVRIFDEFPEVRLVIFGEALHLSEFVDLDPYQDRIENRKMVPFGELQHEIARFDINVAPLALNPFNEAKSELKYFEAALLEVPTVASPTEPFRNVIAHGVNGLLAAGEDEWYHGIRNLVKDPDLRKAIGKKAHQHVLWNFSPDQRSMITTQHLISFDLNFGSTIRFFELRKRAAEFRSDTMDIFPSLSIRYPDVPAYEIVKQFCNGRSSMVGVMVPLYNYEQYILQALDSVKGQTLQDIDLVVVDDGSTDGSLQAVSAWMEENGGRFNNCSLLRNHVNSKLSAARNAGFDHIRTVWVMQLDADNELLPTCLEECLEAIRGTGAGLVYPQLELFGEDKEYIFRSYDSLRLSVAPWDPASLARFNYIDAMALVSKSAWAAVGGYDVSMIHGLEDYDFWLRFVDHGFFGIHIPRVLARYRVHRRSMLRSETEKHFTRIREGLEKNHPWIRSQLG